MEHNTSTPAWQTNCQSVPFIPLGSRTSIDSRSLEAPAKYRGGCVMHGLVQDRSKRHELDNDERSLITAESGNFGRIGDIAAMKLFLQTKPFSDQFVSLVFNCSNFIF